MMPDFSKRRDAEGLWEIIDLHTDFAVILDGQSLSGLDDEQADDAIELLRAGELIPDPVSADG